MSLTTNDTNNRSQAAEQDPPHEVVSRCGADAACLPARRAVQAAGAGCTTRVPEP